MANSLKNIINRGVPVSTPLLLRMDDLISISNNKSDSREKILSLYKEVLNYLSSYFGNYVARIPASMRIYSDPNTLEKSFGLDIEQFLFMVVYSLNAYGNDRNNKQGSLSFIDIDFEELVNTDFELLKNRIEILRSLKDPSQLKKKFPTLFKQYKDWQLCYKNVLGLHKLLLKTGFYSNYKTLEQKMKILSDLKKHDIDVDLDELEELVEDAHKFSFDSFCKDYANIFENILENYDNIKEYLANYTVNCDDLDIDEENFALYIAFLSLMFAETAQDDSTKQAYIYYVVDYFNSDESRKTNNELSINIGVNDGDEELSSTDMQIGITSLIEGSDIDVTPAWLYEFYCNFLKNNPEVKALNLSDVDFSGMSLEDVDRFMTEYLKDIKANWDILPEDDYDDVMDYDKSSSTKTDSTKYEVSEERVLEMYVEKKEFYGSTDPIFRIKGKNTFNGYIGFIYANGKVVLDKFFEDVESRQLAYGEAIYIMDIKDFYELSQYPKRDLIASPKVDKIDHRRGWQEKARNEISTGGNAKEVKDTIKQLKKTNMISVE